MRAQQPADPAHVRLYEANGGERRPARPANWVAADVYIARGRAAWRRSVLPLQPVPAGLVPPRDGASAPWIQPGRQASLRAPLLAPSHHVNTCVYVTTSWYMRS